MLRADLRLRRGALDLDVALELSEGTLALAGPSGAGKTTVLRLICGLERPDRGAVRCDGEQWVDTEAGVDLEVERRRVGVVFQHYALFPHLSAQDNVAFGIGGPTGRGAAGDRGPRARELLERMGLGASAAARRPAALSGGERQRVALARALARDPRLLLLDEPLAALDASTRSRAARELIAALGQAGIPCLLITHDFTEAALLANEVAILEHGRIAQRGPAARLAASPCSPFVAGFTGANVLYGQARPAPDGLTRVVLDGGGELASAESVTGRVAASVLPWEVQLEPPGAPAAGSARNRLRARVTDMTHLGPRVRVGLTVPQPLIAELTEPAVSGMSLRVGDHVLACFKATATRLIEA